MKIITLAISQYKDNDAIIDAINEEKCFSFLAKGVLKPTHKNAAINNPLTIAEVDFQEGNYKYPILKSATDIISPLQVDNDLEYLGSIMFLQETINVLLQPEERYLAFNDLKNALTTLKNQKNRLIVDMIFLSRILKYAGLQFQVNECVVCGNTRDIRAFSFIEGGFICANCLQNDTKTDLSKNQMLLLRAIVNAKTYQVDEEAKISMDDVKFLFTKFFEFIYDDFGVTLKSQKILNI